MNEEEFEALADGGWKYEVESLRQQLAEAQAACSMKDELITDACTALAFYGEQPPEELFLAMTIKPGDSALKAWLGEPVAWMQISVEEGIDTQFPRKEKPAKYNKDWWEFEPLYSPKGLK